MLSTAGATLSIAFSQSEVHHAIIILNTLLVTGFLFIEARRYRFYHVYSMRVRRLEREYFAPLFATTAVITFSLPTGPFTALTITVVQVVLCAMLFYFLLWLQGLVATSFMML